MTLAYYLFVLASYLALAALGYGLGYQEARRGVRRRIRESGLPDPEKIAWLDACQGIAAEPVDPLLEEFHAAGIYLDDEPRPLSIGEALGRMARLQAAETRRHRAQWSANQRSLMRERSHEG